MPTISTLVISSSTSSTASWTPTAIRTSVINADNPNYPRIFQLDSQFITLMRPNPRGAAYIVGITLEALITQFIAIVPQLTWPPIIGTSPTNVTTYGDNSASFAVSGVTSELSFTYQWQKSADGGASWSNVTNAGVYSGATTATLAISICNGLNGTLYRMAATNGSGTTNSTNASLTVDPTITTQPVNHAVVAPAPSSFFIVASGTGSLTYQWQHSTDGGSTWSNLSNAGVYSGVTTANLAISNSTGLDANQFRCHVNGTIGQSTSSMGVLAVT